MASITTSRNLLRSMSGICLSLALTSTTMAQERVNRLPRMPRDIAIENLPGKPPSLIVNNTEIQLKESPLAIDFIRRPGVAELLPVQLTASQIAEQLNLEPAQQFETKLGEEVARRKAILLPANANGPQINSVIELDKAISPAQQQLLKQQGITIEGGGSRNTYAVSIGPNSDVEGSLQALNIDLLKGRVAEPRDKLAQSITPLVNFYTAQSGEQEAVPILIEASRNITTNAQKQELIRKLLAAGASKVEDLGGGTFLIRTDLENLERIAGVDSVVAVDGGPPPFLPLNGAGPSMKIFSAVNLNAVQQFNETNQTALYDGQGTRIGIFDDGIDEAHYDFRSYDLYSSRVAPNHRESKSHGTFVAAIAAGNGKKAEDENYEKFSTRGVAFRATLGDYQVFGLTYASGNASGAPTAAAEARFKTAMDQALSFEGSDVLNHSYVETLREYSLFSGLVDAYILGHRHNAALAMPSRPQVWAAGNNGLRYVGAATQQYGNRSGYYSVFTQAKNSISVGSVDVEKSGVDGGPNFPLSAFSSRGPTFDGRIKPDIVAPGCIETGLSHILGPDLQGYRTGDCGTSYAAPLVSGVIALMVQAIRLKNKPTDNVLPSTYKALLVHGAKDLVYSGPVAAGDEPLNYGAGPDFSTGFGLMDANASITHAATLDRWVERSISFGQADKKLCFEVAIGTPNLRLVLAWDDPPKTLAGNELISDQKLVNDLDISARPAGNAAVLVAKPWILEKLPMQFELGKIDNGTADPIGAANIKPARKATGSETDTVNNVEVIDVDTPAAGRWEVSVKFSRSTATNNVAQQFSLTSDFALQDCQT